MCSGPEVQKTDSSKNMHPVSIHTRVNSRMWTTEKYLTWKGVWSGNDKSRDFA